MTVDPMKVLLLLLCTLLFGMLFIQYACIGTPNPRPPPLPLPVEPLTPRPILQIPVEPYSNVKITRLGIRRNAHRAARRDLPNGVF